MKKILIFVGVFVFAATTLAFAQGSVTLTTYYPAPFGKYQEMRVMGKLGVGRDTAVAKVDVESTDASEYFLARFYQKNTGADNYGIVVGQGNSSPLPPAGGSAALFVSGDSAGGSAAIYEGEIGSGARNVFWSPTAIGSDDPEGTQLRVGTIISNAIATPPILEAGRNLSYASPGAKPVAVFGSGDEKSIGVVGLALAAVGAELPASRIGVYGSGSDFGGYFNNGLKVNTGNLDIVSGDVNLTGGNIALNGGYLSGDGDNEGISISDTGYVVGPVGINGVSDVALKVRGGGEVGVLSATSEIFKVGDDDLIYATEANARINGTLSVGGVSAFGRRVKAYDGVQIGTSAGLCEGELYGTLSVNCTGIGQNYCELSMCAPTQGGVGTSSWQRIAIFQNASGGGGTGITGVEAPAVE